MKISNQFVLSLLGIISGISGLSSAAQASDKSDFPAVGGAEAQLDKYEKNKNFLNYLVENNGISLNENNEINFNEAVILEMIKKSFGQISSSPDAEIELNILMQKMQPGKYQSLQKGANENMSMSFVKGN